jgi:hypothetical protein
MAVYLEITNSAVPQEFALIFEGAQVEAFERAYKEDALVSRPRTEVETALAEVWALICPNGATGISGTFEEIELTAGLLRSCGDRTEEQVARMDSGNGDTTLAKRTRELLGQIASLTAGEITEQLSTKVAVDTEAFANELSAFLLRLPAEKDL